MAAQEGAVSFEALEREFGEATFPRLMLGHARTRAGRPAVREKRLGIWQTTTWGELGTEVRRLAGGFAHLGLQRGQHVALVGENRPRLYAAMVAAQSLGAIPVPLYQDAAAQEMAFVLRDAEITIAIAEDQEQVDKLMESRGQCPALRWIVYDDGRGMRNYRDPQLLAMDRLLELGAQWDAAHAGAFDEAVAAGRADDVAAMFYTSGTTGHPKGVVHTHRSLALPSAVVSRMEGLRDDDDILAYLPMAWIGQNIFSYAQWLINGFTINCPESPATVSTDMREIGPSFYFAPPRVLEQLLTSVTIRMEDASRVKRALFAHFMALAQRIGGRILDGDPGVSAIERLHYRLGDLLIYGPLRNALGMSRVRLAYTAGEAIGPDLFAFYRSLGVNLKQLYGQTETAVWVCVQPDGQARPDTVGPAVPGVEVRVADGGEILVRSPGLLREYHGNPEATAEVKDAQGWYHTGDAGFFDAEKHLRIIDRAKDVGRLAGGAMFAPKYIENKLKFFPFIKEAVAFGQDRDRVCAFVNIDFEACGNWAERRNLPYSGYMDLAQKDEVLELIAECVEKVNADLAQDASVADSQIHRFLVLHKELDPDDDELTRTRKVRRRFIAEKYRVLVDALYEGRSTQYVETPVKFEDGRIGKVAADVRIRDTRTFAALRRAA